MSDEERCETCGEANCSYGIHQHELTRARAELAQAREEMTIRLGVIAEECEQRRAELARARVERNSAVELLRLWYPRGGGAHPIGEFLDQIDASIESERAKAVPDCIGDEHQPHCRKYKPRASEDGGLEDEILREHHPKKPELQRDGADARELADLRRSAPVDVSAAVEAEREREQAEALLAE